MSEITNPHDHFVKTVLSKPDEARSFLQSYLPANVVARLELTTLEVVRDSFVDHRLKAYHSDLIYRLGLKDGGSAFIYVLLEHKSKPEPLIAFHLLRYMVKMWEQLLKQKHKPPLPPIIPLVLYHGEAKWKVGKRLHQLIHLPDGFARYAPDFTYALNDLSYFSDAEIKGSIELQTLLLTFKHIFDPDFADHLPGILRLMAELATKQTGMEYLETFLRYISAAAKELDFDKVEQVVHETLPQGEETMATIAETLIRKGREEGIEQGMEKGMEKGMEQGALRTAQEAIIDILEARFGDVPTIFLKYVYQINDLSVLKQLRRQAVTTESLDQFRQTLREAAPEAVAAVDDILVKG